MKGGGERNSWRACSCCMSWNPCRAAADPLPECQVRGCAAEPVVGFAPCTTGFVPPEGRHTARIARRCSSNAPGLPVSLAYQAGQRTPWCCPTARMCSRRPSRMPSARHPSSPAPFWCVVHACAWWRMRGCTCTSSRAGVLNTTVFEQSPSTAAPTAATPAASGLAWFRSAGTGGGVLVLLG